jgi:glycosyltransferase involved in cell wall biosynthesis
MKRLLIVSPHFVPTNAADMQRVRAVLPYMANAGWRCEVLAVAPEHVASPQDPWLAAGLPADVPVHRVAAMGLQWRRVPALGTLTYRALGAMRRAGNRLLRERNFDLVYFSTAQFGTHTLGPLWRERFCVPFVMDYQDPWVSDYYRLHPDVNPPGGRTKYAVASYFARRNEPYVLSACNGITAVTADYPRQLCLRYPVIMRDMPTLVAPLPGDEGDFRRIRKDEAVTQSYFVPSPDRVNWVYVGVVGKIMQRSLRAFFQALSSSVREHAWMRERLRLHFIGTSYAPEGTGIKSVEPLAREYGVNDLVQELTNRIPYSVAMRCLLDADALIVPGSDDPAYTASKIYPYLLARKPLLAMFHEASSVVELIQKVGGGEMVSFSSDEATESIAQRIRSQWFAPQRFASAQSLNDDAFMPFTASSQAQQLARFFDRCVGDVNRCAYQQK